MLARGKQAKKSERELEGCMLGRPEQRLDRNQALLPIALGVEPLSVDGRPSKLAPATAGPKEQEHPYMAKAAILSA